MKRTFAVLIFLIIAAPSFAWNSTGHKAIAYGFVDARYTPTS
jgi:hypothetical protein